MKKFLIAAVAALLATGAVSAQGWEFGFKAGLNVSSETIDQDSRPRPGINAGLVSEYVFSDKFGFQTELLYSQQGVRIRLEPVTMKLDYITLPLIAKFYWGRASLDAGLQPGYMVNAMIVERYGGYSDSMNIYDDPELNKFELSLCLGFSYIFTSGIDITVRSNLGITPIVDYSDSRHSVAQFSVGYRF